MTHVSTSVVIVSNYVRIHTWFRLFFICGVRASTHRKHRRPKLNTDRPCATILWLRDFLVMVLGLPFRGAPLLIGELISDFSATTTIRCVAFMLIVLALCSFEVLCVIDGQCLNSNANPAVLEASSRWTLVIVVLLLLTAAFMVSFTVKSSGARAKMLSKDTENSIDMSSWDCHAFVIITSLLMVAAMGIVMVLFMIEISSQSEVERKRVKGQWDGGKYSWKVESYYGNAVRLEEQILVLARSLLSFAFLSFALLFLLAGALSSQLLRKSGPI
uniref:Uncharacterized protein n=2 Tax=Octactis speculum TaxID=3111310 RepID=A0A7S2FLA5_9STRA|mmetsp:Transcript_25190/g.34550  ORF Transcript_25190/g.34550 Transcript_25190/m.34550 type:complete len:273 (+) Transcript_25190:275-1093(+)